MSNRAMEWTGHQIELPRGLHANVKSRAQELKGGREGLLKYLYAALGLWALQQPDEVLVQMIRTVEDIQRLPEKEAERIMQTMAERRQVDEMKSNDL